MERSACLAQLIEWMLSIQRDHPLRVAIDGVDAAGKTIMADELAGLLRQRGQAVVRSSIDFFHYPPEIRHRNSATSPESYFNDSFNYPAVVDLLLKPLGPGGSRKIRTAIYDYRVEQAVDAPWEMAADDSILLFDGIFLQRDEIVDHWDLRIFLDVGFDETVARASMRDQYLWGEAEVVRARYVNRYVPGQKLYLAQCDPKQRAHIVIDHHRPDAPVILRGLAFDDRRV
ncbi:MAG: hypothetical protein JW750_10530 [Anaerolineaceae bacterium]|nr:hypothetical protein [Anaerolineaceae bacterium]